MDYYTYSKYRYELYDNISTEMLSDSISTDRRLNMITGELKNKIDSLWDIFAAGGLTNPLDVIEQITYLMFIRDLDDTDNLRSKEAAMLGLPHKSIFADEVQIGDRTIDGKQLKWSVFHDFPADRMYSVMQEWVGKMSNQVQHLEDKNSRGDKKPRHFLGRELMR